MITIETSSPRSLLENMRNAIDQGRITSWIYDDEHDFTLSRLGTVQRAWFHPRIGTGKIRFCIVGVNGENMTSLTYAKYHSHLVNTLLRFFDDEITSISVTPNKSPFDRFD